MDGRVDTGRANCVGGACISVYRHGDTVSFVNDENRAFFDITEVRDLVALIQDGGLDSLLTD